MSWLLLTLACATNPPAEAPAPAAPVAEVPAAPAAPAVPEAPAVPSADPAAWIQFGAPFALASSVPAASVMADPAPHAGQQVRVLGELSEVCQKAGCWAVVRDDAGHSFRITMKDHAFGIAKDGAGRACDVEGELVKKAVDPATLEHYKTEGAKDLPEQGLAETYEIVASTVWVARS